MIGIPDGTCFQYDIGQSLIDGSEGKKYRMLHEPGSSWNLTSKTNPLQNGQLI